MSVKKKPLTKLSISRSLWGQNRLRRNDGLMCCLGHLGVACGIPKRSLLGKGMPNELSERLEKRYPSQTDDLFMSRASCINDNVRLGQAKRESRLKTLFKKAGIRLTFRGPGKCER